MRVTEAEARALAARTGQIIPGRPKPRPEPKHPEGTPLERHLVTLLRQLAPDLLSRLQRNFKFHPEYGFTFDFADPDAKVAVECDGLVHQQHRDKWQRDEGKHNLAVSCNWVVLRCTTQMLTEDPVDFVERLRTILKFRTCARKEGGLS